ncbi:DUF7344 domain-containing protein [Natrinema salinisoli]|uniref:DUF7344 domain-containing protein n=1 Tax=Natrinema salinisoli TaxID=2878535 RepID=UPI001CF078D6|nr:hypothetical protein [Natrinema salinisoli]
MPQPQSTQLETDTVFTILSNETDRSVVRSLRAVQGMTVRELAANITATEPGRSASDLRPNSRTAVMAALRHNHLPRLDACDVIDYDGSTRDVTRGPSFEEIEPFVEALEGVRVNGAETS